MLNLAAIQKYYSTSEQVHTKHIFREYLQYKILEGLYSSPIAQKISFLGGTAIRIVHESHRFSEDLHFDNFDLSFEEFTDSSEHLKRHLQLEGFEVEIRNIQKGAYHCHVKFPEILYKNDLSGYAEEKVLIQIDTVSHGYAYTPQVVTLNKFGVIRKISATPPSILLSQKLYAAFNRKRLKGRDFFDIVFLLGFASPDYGYLEYRLGITTPQRLREYVLQKSETVDFTALAKDVAPFLFSEKDTQAVLLFRDIFEGAKL